MATTPCADSARTRLELADEIEALTAAIEHFEKTATEEAASASRNPNYGKYQLGKRESIRRFRVSRALRDRLAFISQPPAAKPRGGAVAATIQRADGTLYQVVGGFAWVQDQCDFAENNGDRVTRVDLL